MWTSTSSVSSSRWKAEEGYRGLTGEDEHAWQSPGDTHPKERLQVDPSSKGLSEYSRPGRIYPIFLSHPDIRNADVFLSKLGTI